MIRVLQNLNGRQKAELTAAQLDDLTRLPVRLKSGEVTEFTVAELHAKYPQNFEAFIETIPSALREY